MPTDVSQAALRSWAASLPAVRCAGAAIRPWTNAPDSRAVLVTKTNRFDAGAVAPAWPELTTVGHGPNGYIYAMASIPSARAVVLHSGSDEDESTFTAVVGEASPSPVDVARLASAPRVHAGVGLGSTRAAVEAALGPATSTTACGYAIVRYEPAMQAESISEEWFIYRDGRVIAFARYEAV